MYVEIESMTYDNDLDLSFGSLQFERSMTGHRTGETIADFWDHCQQFEEWRDHPCLNDPSIPKSRSWDLSSGLILVCFLIGIAGCRLSEISCI